MVDLPLDPDPDQRPGSPMSTRRDDATSHADKTGWHWPGGGADQRLAQSIGQLAADVASL